ncbi:MAG: hypothetical protein GXY36_17120 [Chloroflexi bacterium]|nr:hypothetical protein [Chloroflexota bacterium]
MSPSRSIFFDEWQACLRSHYVHVIRNQDFVTEQTLRRVLQHAGLTEDDLLALQQEAGLEIVEAETDEAWADDPAPEPEEIAPLAEAEALPDESAPCDDDAAYAGYEAYDAGDVLAPDELAEDPVIDEIMDEAAEDEAGDFSDDDAPPDGGMQLSMF